MSNVIKEAYSWLGTPYHHEARIKGAGVDCAMFLCEVYYTCGVLPFIDPRPYSQDWYMHRSDEKYMNWINQYCTKVEEPEAGDIALFHFGRAISHGGIVVKWPTIIHSYINKGVVEDDASQGMLANRLVGFWRLNK